MRQNFGMSQLGSNVCILRVVFQQGSFFCRAFRFPPESSPLSTFYPDTGSMGWPLDGWSCRSFVFVFLKVFAVAAATADLARAKDSSILGMVFDAFSITA